MLCIELNSLTVTEFIQWLEWIQQIVPEITLTFDTKKMHCQCVDSSRYLLFDLSVPSSVFKTYLFTDKQDSISVCVSVINILQQLHSVCIEQTQSILWQIDPNRWIMTAFYKNGMIQKEWNIHLSKEQSFTLDIEEHKNMDCLFDICLSSEQFHVLSKSVSAVNDVIQISVDAKKNQICWKTNPQETVYIPFSPAAGAAVNVDMGSVMTFSSAYLQFLFKQPGLNDNDVQIRACPSNPLFIIAKPFSGRAQSISCLVPIAELA